MYKGKKVLVTGGASFIGSHLVDRLLKEGAEVIVADNFSSGKWENLQYNFSKVAKGEYVTKEANLKVHVGDLKDRRFVRKVVKNVDIVFHLAAIHGGRGYIATHPADVCTGMIIDQLVFEEACKNNVERICYASSACVYPVHLQEDPEGNYKLKEEDADPFTYGKANADLEYGWTKLMGEMALKAYHRQYGMKTSSVRIFTAYGPRENETHSVIALIAKAFIKMDPFVIWGNGKQKRNYTYIDDIVDALILACEKIEDGTAVNAGREDSITINELAEMIFEIVNWRPNKIVYDKTKPVGVLSRAADLTLARKLLGWEPKVSYKEGLKRTIEWYFSTKDPEEIKKKLDYLLFERS
jgi:UDP-glucose 4-epimerase